MFRMLRIELPNFQVFLRVFVEKSSIVVCERPEHAWLAEKGRGLQRNSLAAASYESYHWKRERDATQLVRRKLGIYHRKRKLEKASQWKHDRKKIRIALTDPLILNLFPPGILITRRHNKILFFFEKRPAWLLQTHSHWGIASE